MKKYLTIGYAYPVYFLLILGQYFLAEGLDSLYNVSPDARLAVQPVRGQADVTNGIIRVEGEGEGTLAKAGSTDGKAGNNH